MLLHLPAGHFCKMKLVGYRAMLLGRLLLLVGSETLKVKRCVGSHGKPAACSSCAPLLFARPLRRMAA